MKHYGIAQWVDFARGLMPERDGAAMRMHLAEGCSECREVADFCVKLSAVCGEMSTIQVPDCRSEGGSAAEAGARMATRRSPVTVTFVSSNVSSTRKEWV